MIEIRLQKMIKGMAEYRLEEDDSLAASLVFSEETGELISMHAKDMLPAPLVEGLVKSAAFRLLSLGHKKVTVSADISKLLRSSGLFEIQPGGQLPDEYINCKC